MAQLVLLGQNNLEQNIIIQLIVLGHKVLEQNFCPPICISISREVFLIESHL
jgi:hypothetical protein